MLELRNQTPFEVGMIPCLDKEGYDYVAIAIKGTFDLVKNNASLSVSEAQIPLAWGDEFYGEPGVSSVKYESDTCQIKSGTDVILKGHAYAKGGGRSAEIDVQLQVGPLNKTVRVIGDRKWGKSLGMWRWSGPEPFDRIPLVYERAFGGNDTSDPDPAKHDYEKRNPVGTGFSIAKKNLEGMPLPNLEDPGMPIKGWDDKPAPAGFGFIGRDWAPRVKYAGTYDEKWQKERFPMLPSDFDPSFFNGASPDLIARPHFKGGEPVRVVNASPEGELKFKLPARRFDISLWIKGKESAVIPVLDTVVIEPDEKRLLLTWRATAPCFKQFLYIDRVRVKEKAG